MKKWFGFMLLVFLGTTAGVVQAEDVTFRVVNAEGQELPGSKIGVGWPWTLQATPYVKDVTLPNNTSIRVEFAGIWGSTTNFGNAAKNISLISGRTVTFDFVSGTILSDELSGDGSTNFHAVIDAFHPTFGLVDLAGNDIVGGQVIFPAFGNQIENTPYTSDGFVRNNWDVSVRGKLNGNQTTTKVITIKKETLQRIDSQDVSQVTETSALSARIDFQYGIFDVLVQTTDNVGNLVTGEVQVAGGGFQNAPLTLSNQIKGTQVAVQGRVGSTSSGTAVVALHPDTTFSINLGGQVTSAYTPGDPKVNVVFGLATFDVVVTDLSGNEILDLDGSTVMGDVFVNGDTPNFVPSGYSSSVLDGMSVGVRGRFDDLATNFITAQVKSDHTTVISAVDGVVSSPVSTPGETRIEFRFDPIVFTTEVVNELGFNLDDALIRVVDYTDDGGLATFVNSPFLTKIRSGNNLNIEIQYASYQEQFDVNSVGGNIFLFDQSGTQTGTASTDLDKSGVRAAIHAAPVTLRTTNGVSDVDGQIKVGEGNFEDAPVVSLPALDGDHINIEARYLGYLMDNVDVIVKEGMTQTIIAATGNVTEQSTPGTTLIEIAFDELDAEVVVTDLNGNPILDLDGSTVLGDVFINGVTADFVPSGYMHHTVNGASLGVRGRFDDLTTGFLTARIQTEHTTVISAANGVVSTPVSTPGQTRIEFRFDPIVFTTEVVNELGINLEDALIRVVDYTDENGVAAFVNSPFLAKIRAGNNLNIEVQYATHQVQFDILSVGGTVYLLDQNGNQTGTTATDPGQGGARAVFDDAQVTIQTTEGSTPVAGQIKIGSGAFEDSPVLAGVLLDGTVLDLEAQYNGIVLDNFEIVVKEDVTQTIKVATQTVVEFGSPGTTVINIDFASNQAPEALIAGDEVQAYYCLANSRYLELDGTQSSDPDGDTPLTYRWKEDGVVLQEGPEASKPTLLLAVGTHTITLEVEDAKGAVGTDVVNITIQNDDEAPVVAIASPQDGAWIKGTGIQLSGSITDNTKLKTAKIDDRNASFSGPNGNYNYTGNARLEAGENVVQVVATDFAGNEGMASITLHADVKKPVSDFENATLTPLAPTSAAFVNGFLTADENEVQVKVNVAISDFNDDGNSLPGSGIDIPNVMIGGENVTLVSGDQIQGVFEAIVTLKGNGNKNIKVWVSDLAGYKSDEHIALKLDTRLPQARISSPSNNALVTTPTVTVIGEAWDDGNANEVASIDVNGVEGIFTGEGRAFRAENVIPNPDGSIVVTVTDLAGKVNTTSVVVNDQSGGGVPASIKLTLISSADAGSLPIEGARVDLLEVRNGSERGTGKKQNTNASGIVEFEIDASKVYRLRITHNNGKYTTGDMTASTNQDVTVQTLLSEFVFKDSFGNALGDVRVDLMDGSGEHLCLKHRTDASGVAGFEILPGLDIRFRVHWLATQWLSPGSISAGGDETLQTKQANLTLTTSTSTPIEDTRVDLRDDTGDHLREKSHTDVNGVAGFEVLPNMMYRFKVYYGGGQILLDQVLTDGQDDDLQTILTTLTLNDHNGTGSPIDGARVDLLKIDENGTGRHVKTGETGHGPGVAGFEVLPGFEHKFKVTYNGGSYITQNQTP